MSDVEQITFKAQLAESTTRLLGLEVGELYNVHIAEGLRINASTSVVVAAIELGSGSTTIAARDTSTTLARLSALVQGCELCSVLDGERVCASSRNQPACASPPNVCESGPCLNGGVCLPDPTGPLDYRCVCPASTVQPICSAVVLSPPSNAAENSDDTPSSTERTQQVGIISGIVLFVCICLIASTLYFRQLWYEQDGRKEVFKGLSVYGDPIGSIAGSARGHPHDEMEWDDALSTPSVRSWASVASHQRRMMQEQAMMRDSVDPRRYSTQSGYQMVGSPLNPMSPPQMMSGGQAARYRRMTPGAESAIYGNPMSPIPEMEKELANAEQNLRDGAQDHFRRASMASPAFRSPGPMSPEQARSPLSPDSKHMQGFATKFDDVYAQAVSRAMRAHKGGTTMGHLMTPEAQIPEDKYAMINTGNKKYDASTDADEDGGEPVYGLASHRSDEFGDAILRDTPRRPTAKRDARASAVSPPVPRDRRETKRFEAEVYGLDPVYGMAAAGGNNSSAMGDPLYETASKLLSRNTTGFTIDLGNDLNDESDYDLATLPQQQAAANDDVYDVATTHHLASPRSPLAAEPLYGRASQGVMQLEDPVYGMAAQGRLQQEDPVYGMAAQRPAEDPVYGMAAQGRTFQLQEDPVYGMASQRGALPTRELLSPGAADDATPIYGLAARGGMGMVRLSSTETDLDAGLEDLYATVDPLLDLDGGETDAGDGGADEIYASID